MNNKKKSPFQLRLERYQQAKSKDPSLHFWDFKAATDEGDNDPNYIEWRESLPENLRTTDEREYNLYGAYQAGLQPHLESDGYHLPSRRPDTGEILKSKDHPTYQKALDSDRKAGYYPIERAGKTYTRALRPSADISGYAFGTDENGVINYSPGAAQQYTSDGRLKTIADYINEDVVDQPYWNGGTLPAIEVSGRTGNPYITSRSAGFGEPVVDRHLNQDLVQAASAPTLSQDNRTKAEIEAGHKQLEADRKLQKKQEQTDFTKNVLSGVGATVLDGVGKVFTPSTYTNLLSSGKQMQDFGEGLDFASMFSSKLAAAPLLLLNKSLRVPKVFRNFAEERKLSKLVPKLDATSAEYLSESDRLRRQLGQMGTAQQLPRGDMFYQRTPTKIGYPSIFRDFGMPYTSDLTQNINGHPYTLPVQFVDETGNVHSTDVTVNPFFRGRFVEQSSGNYYPNRKLSRVDKLHSSQFDQITGEGAQLIPTDGNFQSGVKDYVARLNSRMGDDGVVAGSLVHYGNGTLPGTFENGRLVGPNDTEIYTTRARLGSLQNKLALQTTGGVNPVGGVRGYSAYTFNGNAAHEPVEINVIEQDQNGAATGALAHQIFRALHPKEYAAFLDDAARAEIKTSTVNLPLPTTAEQLLKELHDPKAIKKQVMTDMMFANTRYGSQTKAGDRTRSVLFSEPNETADAEALDVLVSGAIANTGKDYKTAEQMFPKLRFDNIEDNKRFLKEVYQLPDEVAQKFAENPTKMKLLMEQFHSSLTTSRRGIANSTAANEDLWAKNALGENVRDADYEMYDMAGSASGGNVAGGGINRASGAQGGMGQRVFTSNAQHSFTTKPDAITTPYEYLSRAKQATTEPINLKESGLILKADSSGKMQYDRQRSAKVQQTAIGQDTPVFYGPYGVEMFYTGAYVSPNAKQLRYTGNDKFSNFEVGQQSPYVQSALFGGPLNLPGSQVMKPKRLPNQPEAVVEAALSGLPPFAPKTMQDYENYVSAQNKVLAANGSNVQLGSQLQRGYTSDLARVTGKIQPQVLVYRQESWLRDKYPEAIKEINYLGDISNRLYDLQKEIDAAPLTKKEVVEYRQKYKKLKEEYDSAYKAMQKRILDKNKLRKRTKKELRKNVKLANTTADRAQKFGQRLVELRKKNKQTKKEILYGTVGSAAAGALGYGITKGLNSSKK